MEEEGTLGTPVNRAEQGRMLTDMKKDTGQCLHPPPPKKNLVARFSCKRHMSPSTPPATPASPPPPKKYVLGSPTFMPTWSVFKGLCHCCLICAH